METIIVREEKYKGYKYLVVLTRGSHHCGYVLIPGDHPLHGEDFYDNIAYLGENSTDFLDVHGGITWSATFNNDLFKPYGYMIGFDCFHAGDNLIDCNSYYVSKQCENLINQIVALDSNWEIMAKKYDEMIATINTLRSDWVKAFHENLNNCIKTQNIIDGKGNNG